MSLILLIIFNDDQIINVLTGERLSATKGFCSLCLLSLQKFVHKTIIPLEKCQNTAFIAVCAMFQPFQCGWFEASL